MVSSHTVFWAFHRLTLMHAIPAPLGIRSASNLRPAARVRSLQPVRRNPSTAAAGGQVEQQYGWSLEDKTNADGDIL